MDKDKKTKSLAEMFKDFKDGKGDVPVIHMAVKAVKGEDGQMRVILTKELTDLEGETIDVDGLELPVENSVPFIDSHMMRGTVVQMLLGRCNSLTKTQDQLGIKQVEGLLTFASSPNGQIAKALYEEGTATDVSIGFFVKEYDMETRRITQSQLFELSGVIVGANQYAKVQKALELDKSVEDIDKIVENYKEIHPMIKLYRSLFMGKELTEILAYEKTGKEDIDVKAICDIILAKLELLSEKSIKETPDKPKSQTSSENQTPIPATEFISVKQAKELMDEIVKGLASVGQKG